MCGRGVTGDIWQVTRPHHHTVMFVGWCLISFDELKRHKIEHSLAQEREQRQGEPLLNSLRARVYAHNARGHMRAYIYHICQPPSFFA